MAIIQIVNEVYTGSAIVYFLPKFHLRRIYVAGFTWTLFCILVLNAIFFIFRIGIPDLALHALILSFLSTLHGFHNVILLGKGKMQTYNFLVFFQPLVLFAVLVVNVFFLDIRSVSAQVIAMYISWGLSLLISSMKVAQLIANDITVSRMSRLLDVFRNGFLNQLGNLAHTLSNRFNYYIIGGASLVGVYSTASSLIESVFIISGSVSPVILTRIANRKDGEKSAAVTFVLARMCFILSVCCVLMIMVLPDSFFTFFLGNDFKGVKTLMLLLSPGIVSVSFVVVISHYFSGLGIQKVQLIANALGLLTVVILGPLLISRFGIKGAAIAASCAYIVQALVPVAVFMRQNGFRFRQLFEMRKDIRLLKE
jgi:O-antigen/teichoic acid export membrane protein